MKLVKRKNKNQKPEHRLRKNKSFIISIIAVILASIFLYPVVMKNPHIRNIERLIEDEVEDNEFTLECNSKRGQVIEQISVNGDEKIFSEKDVCEKIDKIQKVIYQYISENPSAFDLQYEKIEEKDLYSNPEVVSKFSLEFNNEEEAYNCRTIFLFYFSKRWKNNDNTGFPCLIISLKGNSNLYNVDDLSKFTDIKDLSAYYINIDEPKLLGNMKSLNEICLTDCTGDLEGLKEKAKEMSIECEIRTKQE